MILPQRDQFAYRACTCLGGRAKLTLLPSSLHSVANPAASDRSSGKTNFFASLRATDGTPLKEDRGGKNSRENKCKEGECIFTYLTFFIEIFHWILMEYSRNGYNTHTCTHERRIGYVYARVRIQAYRLTRSKRAEPREIRRLSR